VLQPTLELNARDAALVVERIAIGLVPPVPPGLADLAALVGHQWRVRVERGSGLRPVEEVELDDTDHAAPRFTAAAIAAAVALLGRPHSAEPLSRLLDGAERSDMPAGTADLVALGALEAFMEAGGGETPDDKESRGWRLVPRGLRAERSGRRLATGGFAGDDLDLTSGGREP
jgi:hypothetical protein